MKYLTIDDLKSLLKENILDDLSENDYTLFDQLESYSIGEIDAMIGFKFDVDASFKQRNPFLIMTLIDIFAYHFASRMTHTDMQNIKEERYTTAREWLRDIAMGKIVPNLPMKQEEVGEYVSKNLYTTHQKYSYAY